MTPPPMTDVELAEIRARLNERSVIANNWCGDCDRLLKEVERLRKLALSADQLESVLQHVDDSRHADDDDSTLVLKLEEALAQEPERARPPPLPAAPKSSAEACPQCQAPIVGLWSGVKCSKCDWWECY